MLSLTFTFFSSFWILLADYWIGFYYFGLVTVMVGMIFMVIAICFAILELNVTFYNERIDRKIINQMGTEETTLEIKDKKQT